MYRLYGLQKTDDEFAYDLLGTYHDLVAAIEAARKYIEYGKVEIMEDHGLLIYVIPD